MDSISVPFSAEYGATAIDAIGSDRITVTGGAVIVIGNSPAVVQVRGIARLAPDSVQIEYRATRAQVLGLVAARRTRHSCNSASPSTPHASC